MGEVFLATDEVLQRNVAIKVLRFDRNQTDDVEKRMRFMREARSVAALNHPNIVVIHEIGTTEDFESDSKNTVPYLVMEYVEGHALEHLMRARRLTLQEAVRLGVQIGEGLHAAHQRKIIHRDIKPSNIMVTSEGRIKILDFGISKLLQEETPVASDEDITHVKDTSEGIILGTIRYLSPEQARGQQIDVRSDIFSFGIVLYEMLAGKHPFPGANTLETVTKIVVQEPNPLPESLNISKTLEAIVRKCLRKDPSERYPTFAELLTDLEIARRELWGTAELRSTGLLMGQHYSEDSVETLFSKAPLNQEIPSSTTPSLDQSGAPQLDPTTGEATKKLDPIKTGESQSTISTRELFLNRKSTRLVVKTTQFFLAAIVFGVIATGTFLLFKNYLGKNQSDLPTKIKTTQITLSSSLDMYPSFSPDKNSIAYCSDRSGNFEIYIKQLLPGGREVQLTADSEQNFQPAWSPNGEWIAYHSKNRGGIWIVPAFGGVPRQVSEFGSRPAWSPDGTLIAFQSDGLVDLSANAAPAQPPSTIWTVSVQGGAPKQITQVGNPPGGHGTPSWSPNGKRIAFATYDRRTSAICSITLEGKDLLRVVSTQRYVYDPVYAPDGKYIFYSAVLEEGNYGMWRASVSPTTGQAEGEPIQLANLGLGIIRHLAISNDGKKITYSTLTMNSNLWSISVSASGQVTGKPLSLMMETGRNSRPAFSPDGNRIAFEKWYSGNNPDIWVMDQKGNSVTQLTTDPAVETVPSWTPDGSRIVFRTNREGHPALWSIQTNTRKETSLMPLEGDTDFPRLSPDGKQFAFNSKKGGTTTNVWIAPLEGGQPQPLTFDKESLGFPCWSPDGKTLALQMKRGEDTHIVTIPATGGTPTQITKSHGQSWPYSWSPDGDKIAFAGLHNGFWNIWVVSVATKEQKQITNYAKLNLYVRYPAWSPKGDQIVYEYAETIGNIWVLEMK